MLSTIGTQDLLFFVFGAVALLSGIVVIMAQNPIYSAFSLAFTMIAIAGLFVTLDAFFIAGVQLIVYAGAVMVLFVMVLMLFDLKHEMKSFSKGLISNGLKLASAGVLLGMLLVYIHSTFALEGDFKPASTDPAAAMATTKALSASLFTTYLFAFEAIGALLLIIAVGAVTLSRISGGTHANDQ